MVSKEDILQRSGNGLDVLVKLLGLSQDVASYCQTHKNSKPFRSPFYDDKNASCYLYRGQNGEWYFKDHGGENGLSWWALFIREQNLSDRTDTYYDNLKALCRYMGYIIPDGPRDTGPKKVFRPAQKDEAPGSIKFGTRPEMTTDELLFLFGPMVNTTAGLQQAQETVKALHWHSCESIATTGHPKADGTCTTVISPCSRDYMVFYRECRYKDAQGNEQKFVKIYKAQPASWVTKDGKETREPKFQYYPTGIKPESYINGLDEAKDALQAMRRGCASDVDPDTLKLPELLICCGERDSLVAAYMGYHPVWFNSETIDIKPSEMKQLEAIADTIISIPDIDGTGRDRGAALALQYPKVKTAWLHWGRMEGINDRHKMSKDLRDAMELHPVKGWFEGLLDKALPSRFWQEKEDEKKGIKYELDMEQLHYFLELNGYCRFDDGTVDPDQVVKVHGYIIEESSTTQMLSFLNRWCQDPANYCPKPIRNKVKRLKDPDVQGVAIRKFNMVDCTPTSQIFFFTNCLVEVSKDKVEVRGLDSHPSGYYVWGDKIIKHPFRRLRRSHDITVTTDVLGHRKVNLQVNYKERDGQPWPQSNVQGVYLNSSRLYWREELQTRWDNDPEGAKAYRAANRFTVQGSALFEHERQEQIDTYVAKVFGTGYMLYRRKVASRSVAMMFLDNKIDEEGRCNGRSGKSFISNFITQCGRKVVRFDGRDTKNLFGNFQWERVTRETDICYFDDCGKDFKLASLYSQITGTMTVNRKNKGSFELTASETPKFMLSSNYVMPDFSPSTMERILPEIQSDYYHGEQPETGEERWSIGDDFGMDLHDEEYSEADWNADFNFAIDCCQDYLRLAEIFGPKFTPPMQNIMKRADLDAMGKPFHDWAKDYFFGREKISAHGQVPEQPAIPPHLNCEVVRRDIQELARQVRGCETLSSQTFMQKLRHFANYYDLDFNPKELCNRKTSPNVRYNNVRNARMEGYDGVVEVVILVNDRDALIQYFEQKRQRVADDAPEPEEIQGTAPHQVPQTPTDGGSFTDSSMVGMMPPLPEDMILPPDDGYHDPKSGAPF